MEAYELDKQHLTQNLVLELINIIIIMYWKPVFAQKKKKTKHYAEKKQKAKRLYNLT